VLVAITIESSIFAARFVELACWALLS